MITIKLNIKNNNLKLICLTDQRRKVLAVLNAWKEKRVEGQVRMPREGEGKEKTRNKIIIQKKTSFTIELANLKESEIKPDRSSL